MSLMFSVAWKILGETAWSSTNGPAILHHNMHTTSRAAISLCMQELRFCPQVPDIIMTVRLSRISRKCNLTTALDREKLVPFPVKKESLRGKTRGKSTEGQSQRQFEGPGQSQRNGQRQINVPVSYEPKAFSNEKVWDCLAPSKVPACAPGVFHKMARASALTSLRLFVL